MTEDYHQGFDAGLEFCKWLSEQPKGTVSKFFPYEKGGTYCNGFAEGTITGKRQYKLNWNWVDDGNGHISNIIKL